MNQQSDKKFLNSMWITVNDSLIAEKRSEIGNAWDRSKPMDRYSDLEEGPGLPVFRKKFGSASNKPVKCVIYATALGNFELFMNGQRVGKKTGSSIKFDELKPGWTDYSKRTLYYTYNLTPFLSESGVNCIIAPVSNGWYQGRISFNTYGTHKIAFNAVLEITYEDGSIKTVTTGTDWDVNIIGPVLTADIWDGEVYDATRTSFEALSEPGKRSAGWVNAEKYEDFAGIVTKNVGPSIRVRRINMKPLTLTRYSDVDTTGETDFGKIIVSETIKNPGAVTLKKGEKFIYDMGQNMVGWVNFTVSGKKGTRLISRYAEMLNDSGLLSRGNDGPEGSIYTANYRSAKARGTYILGGGEASYHPMFTFYGFRYIELSADADVEIKALKADVVGSDTRETGSIVTSSKDVNKLISNILWGQRGNYLSIPTDCPQRDERLGWTGDTQIFCGTAAYNANVLGFFRKWLVDAADSQSPAGAFSDVIPRVRVVGEGNAAWGDAPIIVAYTMYRMFGDVKIVKDTYPSLVKYMDYLFQFGYNGPNPAYGDWLAYEPTENRYICICYYAYDAILMEKLSNILGKTRKAASYRKLYTRIRTYFRKTYMKNGKLTQTSQTAYLLALRFGLLPERYAEKCKKILAKKIRDNGYRLSTGFVGTGILNMSLSEFGMDNLAYSLLLQTENPSWLYSVYQGATTIWERWNSYTLDRGFGDVGMNSFNHYAYGSIQEWMYKYMLGIDNDESDPGFRHIILRPTPDTRTAKEMPKGQEHITWVRGHYDSVAGDIAASWSIENDAFTYSVSIPEGAYATLYLPIFDENAATITCNGTVSPVSSFERESNKLRIDLAYGKYTFVVMR